MPLHPCPHVQQLRDYLVGRLAKAELDGVSEHLSDCTHCQTSIRALDNADDELVWQLRQPVTGEPLLDEPELQQLLPRLVSSSTWTDLRTSSATPEVAAAPVPPSDSLGRYQVLKKVGQGGMGTVYKAYDPKLKRFVAIKVPQLDPSRPDHSVAVQRFVREAQAAASVRHPYVCPIYDVGDEENRPYAVMEFIDGRSLSALLKERELPLLQGVDLVRKVALGLEAVHGRGLIHRDVKPGNILLDAHDEPFLTDFGLVRPVSKSEHLTREGGILGTPEFMAPEQAAGQDAQVSPRTDIYSLGVVLYRLVTGKVPFEGPTLQVLRRVTQETPATPRSLRPELDTALEAIVLKAMAFRSEDRFPTAGAFAAALADWSKATSASQPRSSSATEVLPDEATTSVAVPRRRWAAIAAAGALASVMLLIGGSLLYPQIAILLTAKNGEAVMDDKGDKGDKNNTDKDAKADKSGPDNVALEKSAPPPPDQDKKETGNGSSSGIFQLPPGVQKVNDLPKIPPKIPVVPKLPRL